MKRLLISTLTMAALVLSSCSGNETSDATTASGSDSSNAAIPMEKIQMEANGIKLIEVVGSPEFPDTKLSLKSPSTNAKLAVGKVDFEFSVSGGTYTLGSQTADASTKSCANSGKGQHIHLILNNAPYEASYDSNYTTSNGLEAGNYAALAFISRSYHESLKHKDAYVLTQFKVGEEEMDEIDLEAPHLFYSRPKGEYTAEDVNNVMLDFYLVNTEISENGNYVQVTINDSTNFKITKWAPYFIEGLALGTNKIEIQLFDKDGNFIEGPFNRELREFNLVK